MKHLQPFRWPASVAVALLLTTTALIPAARAQDPVATAPIVIEGVNLRV